MIMMIKHDNSCNDIKDNDDHILLLLLLIIIIMLITMILMMIMIGALRVGDAQHHGGVLPGESHGLAGRVLPKHL